MPVRFRRSIKLGPGLKFNINKKSVGFSVGMRGAHYTVNTRGQRTKSVGLPGTGLWYTERSTAPGTSRSPGSGPHTANRTPSQTTPQHRSLPKPGWFAPSSEKQFYAGLKAYLAGDLSAAYEQFDAASHAQRNGVSADLFAGVTANQLENQEKAIEHLEKVVAS